MSKRSRRRNNSPKRPALPAPRPTGPPPQPADPDRLLLDAIADGELDHSLHALADAVHARLALLQTVKAASALAKLSVGDVVRLNHQVRPRYLQGAQGKVVAVDERDATVACNDPSAALIPARFAARPSRSSASRQHPESKRRAPGLEARAAPLSTR